MAQKSRLLHPAEYAWREGTKLKMVLCRGELEHTALFSFCVGDVTHPKFAFLCCEILSPHQVVLSEGSTLNNGRTSKQFDFPMRWGGLSYFDNKYIFSAPVFTHDSITNRLFIIIIIMSFFPLYLLWGGLTPMYRDAFLSVTAISGRELLRSCGTQNVRREASEGAVMQLLPQPVFCAKNRTFWPRVRTPTWLRSGLRSGTR